MARYPFGEKAEDVAQTIGPTGSVMVQSSKTFIFFNAKTGGSEVTDLATDSAGAFPITEGTYTTDLYGNFTKFYGPDSVVELWAQCTTAGAGVPRVLLTARPSALPASGYALTGGTAWAASTAYVVGAVFIKASDGSYRTVKTAYTSGGTYGSTDDANSVPTSPAAPTFVQSAADALYTPLSGSLSNMQFWDGRALKAGYDMNANGFKMPFTGSINQIQAELDLPTVGADTVLQVTNLNTGSGGNVETQVAIVRILAGTVSTITPLVRTDASCTTTSGSSTIGDTHITLDDFGRAVTGTGIPASSYVGTVTAGTSFVLSSSPTVSTARNATATGTVSLTIGAVFAVTKKDKMFVRALSVGSTYPGKALMMSLAFGAETFATCTTPGSPSGLSQTSSTATTVTFGWTAGSNSSQTIVYRDGAPWDYVGSLASYTDGPLGIGESHTYGVQSRRGTAVSSIVTAGTTFGPSSALSLLPYADGAPPATFSRDKGTSVTANPLISSNRYRMISGATGSNAVSDKLILVDVGDTTKAFEIQAMGNVQDSQSYFQLFGSCTSFTPSTGGAPTTYIQAQLNEYQWKVGYNVGAGFVSLGSGSLALTPGTDYGFRFVGATVDPTAGTQVITLYQGSAAAFAAGPGTLTQIATYTLTNTVRSAIPAGKMIVQQLGAQVGATAKTEYTDFGAINFLAGTS